jgi:dye decolorizing peroxidase
MSDSDPTIATVPARLTITFGFGHGLFDRVGLQHKKPEGFIQLPAFAIDELRPEFSGGDLLIQIGSDDPLTLSHAQRHMSRVVSSIAKPHFAQRGFARAAGSTVQGETPRNLMGFKDGTENPRTDAAFADQVWAGVDAGWFAGGTQLVIRRIAMKLDPWDRLGVGDKEGAIGRRIDSGAPLTGGDEFDVPDFTATKANGLTVIPDYAHMRRAHNDDPAERFLRRPFNYDEGFTAGGEPNVGLIFTAYTTNIERRFLPVQKRLAEMDLLNVWTTPIGSSEFVIPPGVSEGEYIGQSLFEG